MRDARESRCIASDSLGKFIVPRTKVGETASARRLVRAGSSVQLGSHFCWPFSETKEDSAAANREALPSVDSTREHNDDSERIVRFNLIVDYAV